MGDIYYDQPYRSKIVKRDEDGNQLWSRQLPDYFTRYADITATNEYVYAVATIDQGGNYDKHYVHQYNIDDGTRNWEGNPDRYRDQVFERAWLGADETGAYLGISDEIHCWDAAGNKEWQAQVDSIVDKENCALGEGKVFVLDHTQSSATVWMMNKNDGYKSDTNLNYNFRQICTDGSFLYSFVHKNGNSRWIQRCDSSGNALASYSVNNNEEFYARVMKAGDEEIFFAQNYPSDRNKEKLIAVEKMQGDYVSLVSDPGNKIQSLGLGIKYGFFSVYQTDLRRFSISTKNTTTLASDRRYYVEASTENSKPSASLTFSN